MSLNNYQQYKTQSVNTMTNSEMLILLFDELLKRLKRAEIALDKEDYVLFDQSANRATEIVTYLKTILNREYTISRELYRMYDFFLYELSRIRAGRNAEVIQEMKPLVEELRDAFVQAAKLSNV